MPQLWRQFSRKGKQCLHGVTLVLIWHVLTEICAAMCFRICPYLFNSALKSANLGLNDIGDEGVIAISEALKTNSTLTELMLESRYDLKNKIGPAGAQALADMLKVNSALKELDIRENGVVAKSRAGKAIRGAWQGKDADLRL